MHLFLKKIYRKNPFPKIYRINQCEVLSNRAPTKFPSIPLNFPLNPSLSKQLYLIFGLYMISL